MALAMGAVILRPLQEGTTYSDRWQVEIDFSNKAPHEILRTDSRVSEDVDSKNGLISFLKIGPPRPPSKSKTHRISNPQIVIFPRYILKEIDQIYIQKVHFSPNFNPPPQGYKGAEKMNTCSETPKMQ